MKQFSPKQLFLSQILISTYIESWVVEQVGNLYRMPSCRINSVKIPHLACPFAEPIKNFVTRLITAHELIRISFDVLQLKEKTSFEKSFDKLILIRKKMSF